MTAMAPRELAKLPAGEASLVVQNKPSPSHGWDYSHLTGQEVIPGSADAVHINI
jgi:hypothetical protein